MSARKKNRRKKNTRATRTVAASAPVKKTPVVEAPAQETPTAETPSFRTPPANPDFHQLEQASTLLQKYGLGYGGDGIDGRAPNVNVLFADPNFRRRPVTTMLTQVDPDGIPLMDRVFIDEGELTRTSTDDLKCFITQAAERAGTAEQLSDIVVMLDPGATTTGSLRYTIDQTVRDHSFDLDPGFGAAQVETEILQGLAPYGYDAYTFYALPGMKPVTIWIPSTSDDELVEALQKENEEVSVPEPQESGA